MKNFLTESEDIKNNLRFWNGDKSSKYAETATKVVNMIKQHNFPLFNDDVNAFLQLFIATWLVLIIYFFLRSYKIITSILKTTVILIGAETIFTLLTKQILTI